MTLSDDQAHHIAKVMRFKPGEKIVLFDGTGKEYSAELEHVSKKNVTLRVFSVRNADRLPDCRLTMAVALPRGDRQKFLIEKLVELGVSTFVPLNTERAVSIANEKVISRINRQIIEACKQCGRNDLMNVLPAQSLSALKEDLSLADETPDFAIASPDAETSLSLLEFRPNRPIVIAIGPEGGFERTELELAIRSGWQLFSLGPSILRMETAAIAVAAILGIGQRMQSS